MAVLRDTWRRANSRGDLRAALANPAYRLRRRLLGISHPPGLVAATSAGPRGHLSGDDSAVVGRSRCGERLLRACVRSGRHRLGALASAVWGGYLMRGDGV